MVTAAAALNGGPVATHAAVNQNQARLGASANLRMGISPEDAAAHDRFVERILATEARTRYSRYPGEWDVVKEGDNSERDSFDAATTRYQTKYDTEIRFPGEQPELDASGFPISKSKDIDSIMDRIERAKSSDPDLSKAG